MNIYRKMSFWYTILILIIFFAVILMSLTYGEKARLVPLLISISGAVLTLFVLIGEKYPDLIKRFDFSLTQFVAEEKENGTGHAQAGEIPLRGILTFLAWVMWAAVLIFFIGFQFAIPLYVFSFLKIFGRLTWLRSIITAVMASCLLYGLFEIALKVSLFKGILFGELIPQL